GHERGDRDVAPADLRVVLLRELEERDQLLLVRHDVRAAVEVDVVRVQETLLDAEGRVDLQLLLDLREGVPSRRPGRDRAEGAAAATASADLDEPVHAGEADGGDLFDLRSLLRPQNDVGREELVAEGLADDLSDVDVALPLDDRVDAAERVDEFLDPGKLRAGRGGQLPRAGAARDDLHAAAARLDDGRLRHHALEVDTVERLLLHQTAERRA